MSKAEINGISITDYSIIEKIIEKEFSSRLKMHRTTGEVYFDGKPFSVIGFRKTVNSELGFFFTRDKHIKDAVYHCAASNLFSPVEDYLKECFRKHPDLDYNDIFRHLNENVLHIDPDSLEALYLPRTLVAAVKRVFEPGCQHDTVLILQGGQGLYKTSLFRELAGKDWFASLTLERFNRDEIAIWHNHWFNELGEIENSVKSYNASRVKDIITRVSDPVRKLYSDNSTKTLKRESIFVGTTNQEKILYDPTGNRRFWIISIDQKIDIDWVTKNRDLIWSAAVQAYKAGYPTYLNEVEQKLSDAINSSKYVVSDMWTELVAQWVLAQKKSFTLSDVLIQALDKKPGTWKRSDQTRVKNILKTLGFTEPKTTTRVNGKPGKYWCNDLTVQQ